MKLIVFPTPLDAHCVLTPDTHAPIIGVPDVHPTGRPGKSFDIPSNVISGHGASYDQTAPGTVLIHLRGRLVTELFAEDVLLVDDFQNQPEKVCPPCPEPVPPTPIPPQPPNGLHLHPLTVMEAIWKTGAFDLTTHSGCGQFTAAAVDSLHRNHVVSYGHVKKFPPQNNYNGHAVDALNLLKDYTLKDGTVIEEGIYDIIFSTESPEAKPVFNRVGPSRPDLWYWP